MKTLDRKVIRELLSLKAQAITIGLVVASGVAVFIASQGAYDSLWVARERFYTKQAFSQGFASFKSAPASIYSQISEISGIGTVKVRIVKEAVLDFPEETLPSAGRFVSISEGLNRISLRSGRLPKGDHEVLISEAFADANQLSAGKQLTAILNGQRKILTITGTALSPEFVYVFRATNPLPDDKHYGIFWMDHSGMESSFNMEGAVNDLIFTFAPGANTSSILHKIDSLLEPYGGLGAYDRDKLPSHSFLRDEFKQLRITAYSIPLIFLGVAAFLLHIVSTRIISKEREQIATLKALGYGKAEIALHYIKIISVISTFGSVLGVAIGLYLGEAMTNLYGMYYKFPDLKFEYNLFVWLQGILIGLFAGGMGATYSMLKVLRLNPAQAMRPPMPETFSKNWMERYARSLPTIAKIILRNLTRRPLRTALAISGISTSVMIMVLGMFSQDAVDTMLDLQFGLMQRDSVTVSFLTPVSYEAVRELTEEKGVLLAEGYRMIPIRIRVGNHSKELGLQGIPEDAKLRRLIGLDRQVMNPPSTGIFLNSTVAEKLKILKGDSVRLEVLEGSRKQLSIKIEGIVDEILGQGAYMERSALNSLMGEVDSVNLVALRTDRQEESNLLNRLKDFPKVSGVSTRTGTLKVFYETMSRSVLATALILLGFASVISVGVVYNSAMIALSERSFELGSLRILGFRKEEVFTILAGELLIEIIASIPLGCFLGYGFAYIMMETAQTEGFKVPLMISSKTYAIAVLSSLGTALVSFAILYLKIQKMDLISVLKIRE
ncbi:ABC transporter permease [Leptospira perolatii]|uniref:ABC transporter permease n=1 Tax=Leptospira perolatii TaxID=2023191 RepID=UPI00267A0A14